MAVESRFVVIRQGVEVATFMDKKAADEYDKMLDMADNLSEMFENSPVEINESMREELSIYLAQNREQVLIALQAKKAKPAAVQKNSVAETVDAKPAELKPTEPKLVESKPSKAKASGSSATEKTTAVTKRVPAEKKAKRAKAVKSVANDAKTA